MEEGNADFLAQLQQVIKQNKLVVGGICEVCGEINPVVLRKYQKHHESTRAYSDSTCVLCDNCHNVQTYCQNRLSRKFNSRKLPIELRLPYIFLSHTAIRKRMDDVEERLLNEIYGGMKDGTIDVKRLYDLKRYSRTGK